ncbi:Hypothetical protein FNO222_1086 [Francisella orientalis]|uniref:Uncharacterized protein n=1 Tax=Francisella orientalis TaxID=299583 RepID=A0ABM5U6B2_9GAMM|nr:hypothetical protein FNO12_1077 [Francisella orientalis FNO12]AKN87245.1 Hypothetical protein FNO24_1079 [Francisella orientalis FNO24]AKN88782.1 Hypothetical protein FNO190_1077 [Francisella orientalis]AKU05540.1 Hypothetical protein FNO01_1077 [Francisella orientalis]QEN20453.1 Hypothetical protein FNO39_1086 [Francisella orientalis]
MITCDEPFNLRSLITVTVPPLTRRLPFESLTTSCSSALSFGCY